MPEFNQDRLASPLAAAGEAMNAFASGPAREASEAMARSFEAAGERMSAALAKSARSGETSLRQFARNAIDAFSSVGDGPDSTRARFDAREVTGRAHGPIHVHFHLGGGIEDVRRHQGQIAAHLARAVAYGRGKL